MEGNLAILALIWWVFAIINIVCCVKAAKRYKRRRMYGAPKRIILSWVIVLSGIIAGSIFGAATGDPRNPMTTVIVTFCTSYLFEFFAIMYVCSGATEESLNNSAEGS